MITKRDLVIAAVAVAATVAGSRWASSGDAPLPFLHSSVFDWKAFPVEQKSTGSRRECLDARTVTLDRLEVHVTTLNPGESPHPAHQHPEEELIIVKTGTLEALQNQKTSRVEAGGLIFEGSNELHGLRNPNTTPAVYYVVKWFTPTTKKRTPAGSVPVGP